jgi:hypothetical protein
MGYSQTGACYYGIVSCFCDEYTFSIMASLDTLHGTVEYTSMRTYVNNIEFDHWQNFNIAFLALGFDCSSFANPL